MIPGCKRLHARKCKFCDRFWRFVIAYVVPVVMVAAFGGCVGAVTAFYWVGSL